mgnify:CR=1 FL=1
MRSSKVIHIVSCHAEGEVGDVIVGGVAPPPGATLWEQRNFIAEDKTLRNFVLNEPRGGVFRHINLLVPPKDPRATMGFIIMEPEDTPPMSGSNSICVSTVLLDSGIRSGADVFKALALGADAILLGRPYFYGLALAGQRGVEDVVRNIVAELDLTMALTGVRAAGDVPASTLRRG